jgi:uncharacterized cupin superfamily protein
VRISGVPFATTDWAAIEPTEHRGATGTSLWRTVEVGDLRVRRVSYSPGYRADHGCTRGHVLLVLEGELTIILRTGRTVRLGPGMGFQVGDDEANPHLAQSESGAEVFIVD